MLLAGPVLAALNAARPFLEPKLEDKGLVWEDLEPLFPILTDEGQIEKLVTDPEAFFQELWESGEAEEAAKVLAIFFMRPQIEPKLPQALDFETVVAVLRLVDTYDELQSAAMDPQAFMLELGDTTLIPILRNMFVSLLLEVRAGQMLKTPPFNSCALQHTVLKTEAQLQICLETWSSIQRRASNSPKRRPQITDFE